MARYLVLLSGGYTYETDSLDKARRDDPDGEGHTVDWIKDQWHGNMLVSLTDTCETVQQALYRMLEANFRSAIEQAHREHAHQIVALNRDYQKALDDAIREGHRDL